MNQESNAIDLVRRLQVALSTRHLPEDIADWLEDGLSRFLAGETTTLCSALGLRTSGRRGRVGTALRQDDRDRALRAAAAALADQPDPAAALACAVRRFESSTWPRVRDLPAPPDRFDDTQRALFAAFRAGQPPRSRSGILAAIKRER